MQTEQAVHTPRVSPPVVSAALQDLLPPTLVLLDGHGRPVPLSAAGHVIRPGEKYRLRVTLPADARLDEVRVNTPPDFVKLGQHADGAEDGRRYREFPFRVERGLASLTVLADSLDVEVRYPAGTGLPSFRLELPVVVRPGWALLLSGLGATLATALVPVLGDLFFREGETSRLAGFLTGGFFWIIAAAAGLLTFGVFGWVGYQLRQRAAELHARFLERFPDQPA